MMDVGLFYANQLKQHGDMNGVKLIPFAPVAQSSGTFKVDPKPVASILDLGRSLLESAKEGHTEKVYEYMRKGAPFTTDWLGTSPLHLAAKNNHLETCKVLLRGGLNKECKTKVERTPLHFAVCESNVEIVMLLLAHNANPNAKDMLKMTPLHWAVEKNCEEIVELLLQHGADVNVRSKFGKTPLYMAEEKGNRIILNKLRDPVKSHANIRQTEMATSSLLAEMKQESVSLPENVEEVIESDVDMVEEDDGTSSNIGDAFMQLPDTGGTTSKAGIELLKEHGIQILKEEEDSNSVIQSALNSGRRLILSEAGKFVLKNSLDTDVFPTTSSHNHKPPPQMVPQNLALQKSSSKFSIRSKFMPPKEKRKIIQMTTHQYRELFSNKHRSTPPISPVAKVVQKLPQFDKLPHETVVTTTMLPDNNDNNDLMEAAATSAVTLPELDKQVQEIRKECEDLRKQLDISRRQNQEYQRRLEKLEAIILNIHHHPS